MATEEAESCSRSPKLPRMPASDARLGRAPTAASSSSASCRRTGAAASACSRATSGRNSCAFSRHALVCVRYMKLLLFTLQQVMLWGTACAWAVAAQHLKEGGSLVHNELREPFEEFHLGRASAMVRHGDRHE